MNNVEDFQPTIVQLLGPELTFDSSTQGPSRDARDFSRAVPAPLYLRRPLVRRHRCFQTPLGEVACAKVFDSLARAAPRKPPAFGIHTHSVRAAGVEMQMNRALFSL